MSVKFNAHLEAFQDANLFRRNVLYRELYK